VQLLTRQVQAAQAALAPQTQQRHGLDQHEVEVSWDGDAADTARAVIEVKTVDGYQGREKEAIVFSAVRSNVQGQVRAA
jgi:hypothetical protein